MKTICRFLWWISESSGIGLGQFAPQIFDWAIGSKPVQMKRGDTGAVMGYLNADNRQHYDPKE